MVRGMKNVDMPFYVPNQIAQFSLTNGFELQRLGLNDLFTAIGYTSAIKDIVTINIQLFQFTLSDQSLKDTGQDRKAVWVD